MSLDFLKDAFYLTVGAQSKVVVLKLEGASAEKSSLAIECMRLDDTSDNVSAVKTCLQADSKSIVTLFATYNGRVSFFKKQD